MLSRSVLKVTVIIALSILSLGLGYLYSSQYQQTTQANTLNDKDYIESSPTDEDVFPPSNIEWFNMFASLSKGRLDSFEVTWRASGEAIEISEDKGSLGGFEYYTTGPEKGKYEYYGRIMLLNKNHSILDGGNTSSS